MKVVTTNLLDRFWKNGIKPIKDALSGKVDRSKIVNSLLATEEGFALDARQGKILDDKITELNGKTMELICETGATSYTTFSGLDLSKYKYFILNTGTKSSNTRKVNATAIIPGEFREYTGTSNIQEASFAKEPSYYCATMYFISDSSVAMKSTSIYDYAWLYGMP